MLPLTDTIAAIATPPGQGAIGIVRLSGPQAIQVANSFFAGKDLLQQPTHTIHFGRVKDGNQVIDEVVASLYKGPKSYTGEDVVELSCHGSNYVLQQVMALCTTHGARLAQPGEFTLRAYLNGKLDLAQAEAVADLIASQTSSAHQAAIHHLRGGFSHDLQHLREELITFSALVELELDFSQEDVEFADRTQFYALIHRLTTAAQQLADSFRLGNALKNGVSVAIIGRPNAGKSTLLNALLNEERAIVSPMAGTTRDTIEETLNINGILFRFIDTAGLHDQATDAIEQQGIARSRQAMQKADIVVLLLELHPPTTTSNPTPAAIAPDWEYIAGLQAQMQRDGIPCLLVANKVDVAGEDAATAAFSHLQPQPLLVSARNKQHIHLLRDALYQQVADGTQSQEGTIVTNARHYNALQELLVSLGDIKNGLDTHLPGDLISLDIRRSLHYLGEITGQITTEDKLDYIFSKFCIGK